MAQVAAALVSVLAVPPDLAADPSFGLAASMMLVQVNHGWDMQGHRISQWESASRTRLAEDVYARASQAIRSIPDAVKQPYLRSIVDGGGPQYGRIWAYAALVMSGDMSRLEAPLAYLLRPSPQARATSGAVKDAYVDTNFSEKDVPFFVQLVKSTDESIRESATRELMLIRSQTPVALKAMGAALRDEDAEVRQNALSAVCSHIDCSAESKTMDMEKLTQPATADALAVTFSKWLAEQGH